MASFIYNLSTNINYTIKEIEAMRAQIALFPLSKSDELELKWEACISKIYWSLAITKNSLTRSKISLLLHEDSLGITDSPVEDEHDAVGYKKALDYIENEWFATKKKVNLNTLISLYIASRTYKDSQVGFTQADIDELTLTLEYLQSGNEHPIIQASIAQIQLRLISPFYTYNGVMSRLLRDLFLYKAGYDFRGMLIIDEYYERNLSSYKKAVTATKQTGNLTPWLEHYVEGVYTQASRTLDNLKNPRNSWVDDQFWKLNTRQKQILSLLDNPQASIKNNDVQERFSVSQITASRDLSQLQKLGLLIAHGKGRSTRYTKV